MSLLTEAFRAAGNVLLRPTRLSAAAAPEEWRRALLVGSRNPELIEQTAAELRAVSPDVEVGTPEPVRGARARDYDVVCLLLTGEGLRREKVLTAISGAPVVLARGPTGRWYRLRVPRARLGSARWWARAALAAMLCTAYGAVVALIAAVDLLRRALPPGPPPPDPGPPRGLEVTFVVPTYNQRDLMDFCLPPLLAEARECDRVMVVDDASADDTAEYVRTQYPEVRVVRLPRNRGFAGAVRAGIAASTTPLFSLINTDVQVRAGFLAAMLPHFRRQETFAVCSRIELPGGSQMETGNVAPAFSGLLEPYHVPPTRPGPILYAGGASSIYHRARCDALGGFETMYRPLYYEDIELGYRAWRRGWRSEFEPQASVYHQHRAWIGKRFGNAYANETFLKNGLLFVWKNVRDRGLLAQHAASVCARLVAEVLEGDAMMCRAVLRALPLAPRALLKRWSEHRRGDLSDREILSRSMPPSAQEFEEDSAR